MKNAQAVISVSNQLENTCKRISSLACGIQESEGSMSDLSQVYDNLLMDQVEHAQILVLELTKLLAYADDMNTDEGGSVFAAGDLTHEKAGELDGIDESQEAGAEE